jgi:transcriptional regulator with XRE-family HTH domain
MGNNVGVSQHSARKTWYWLRGSDGAGQALAGVRRTAGLTQAELADRLGIDRTTMLNMEAGRNPAINRFIGAFDHFGYDLVAVPRGAQVSVTFDKAHR